MIDSTDCKYFIIEKLRFKFLTIPSATEQAQTTLDVVIKQLYYNNETVMIVDNLSRSRGVVGAGAIGFWCPGAEAAKM